MWDWIKQNPGTVFLIVLAFGLVGRSFNWFLPVPTDDPTAPVRTFTQAHWQAEVLDARQPVLVDFWAPWCPPCRSQGPLVAEAAKAVSGTAVVGKVNVETESALAERYGITGIPALLIFKDGREIRRFVGLTRTETLVQALR
jgi:thioredoxin 1